MNEQKKKALKPQKKLFAPQTESSNPHYCYFIHIATFSFHFNIFRFDRIYFFQFSFLLRIHFSALFSFTIYRFSRSNLKLIISSIEKKRKIENRKYSERRLKQIKMDSSREKRNSKMRRSEKKNIVGRKVNVFGMRWNDRKCHLQFSLLLFSSNLCSLFFSHSQSAMRKQRRIERMKNFFVFDFNPQHEFACDFFFKCQTEKNSTNDFSIEIRVKYKMQLIFSVKSTVKEN